MSDNFDSYPTGTFASALATSIFRGAVVVLGGIVLVALIGLGVFAWGTLFPSKVEVAAFNRWYGTTLSSRQIHFKEQGFVDSEFYAAIPMTQQDFADAFAAVGMQLSTGSSPAQASKDPWWYDEPKSAVFILNRVSERTHRDYIEGHYDSKNATGYFHYFDHGFPSRRKSADSRGVSRFVSSMK